MYFSAYFFIWKHSHWILNWKTGNLKGNKMMVKMLASFGVGSFRRSRYTSTSSSMDWAPRQIALGTRITYEQWENKQSAGKSTNYSK